MANNAHTKTKLPERLLFVGKKDLPLSVAQAMFDRWYDNAFKDCAGLLTAQSADEQEARAKLADKIEIMAKEAMSCGERPAFHFTDEERRLLAETGCV